MQTIRKTVLPVIFAVVLSATACVTPGDYIRGTPDKNILLYGHIKFAGSNEKPDWVSLARVLPKADGGSFYIYGCYTYYGDFFQGNLTPGSYAFYRMAKGSQPYDIGAGSDGFRLQEPGAYFAGSYEIKTKGMFSRTFDFFRTDSPTEAEVIRRIMRYVKGTEWEGTLVRRLQKLEEGL